MSFDTVGWIILALLLYAASLLFDAIEARLTPLKNAPKPVTALAFLGFVALVGFLASRVMHVTLPPDVGSIIPTAARTVIGGMLTAAVYAHGAASRSSDGP